MRKRIIIGNNLIFDTKKRPTFKSKIRSHLYKYCLNKHSFYATVNSTELISTYVQYFDVPSRKFYKISDAVDPDQATMPFIDGNHTVFCGGTVFRDWDTYFRTANLLPNTTFVAAAKKSSFASNIPQPKNVILHFDLPFNTFLSELSKCSIVYIPLKTDAPAGLIVLFQSIFHHKPIVITDTSSTKNYIEHNKNGYLVKTGDEFAAAEYISLLQHSINTRENMANSAFTKLAEYSPENCAKQILEFVNQIVTNGCEQK